MTCSASWWYLEHLSPLRRLRMLVSFIPSYVRHLTVRPYRRQLASPSPPTTLAQLGARHAAAALDVWVDRLLKAYSRLAGCPVRPPAGELAVHYIRLLAVFNREYEHRLAVGGSLAMTDLVSDPLMSMRLGEWKRFARRYTQDDDVVRFLDGADVAMDYSKYVAVTSQPGFSEDADLIVESMRLDSGGYLVYLIRLIERFHKRPPAPQAIHEEFFSLGMIAKLADELADLAIDYAEGRYNILLALIAMYPAEKVNALRRLEQTLPMPITRWLEHAPQSFGRFCAIFEHYYVNLRSRELRTLCDMTMIRALGGPRMQQRARSVQHVSERPAEPWR